MKKKYAYILIIKVAIFGGCSKIEKNESSVDTTKNIQLELDYSHSDYVKDILNIYVDSLNNYRRSERIPQFLYSSDFDVNLKKKYWSLNNYISIKEVILNYVDNIVLLDTIITDPTLLNISRKENSTYSVVSLAKRRREQITE